MVEFKERADKKIFQRYGVKVEHWKAIRSFEEQFYEVIQNGKHAGDIYGYPQTVHAWCNDRLKMRPLEMLKNICGVRYLGIASDETDASAYKLFCVLEPDDVKKFINVLHWALDGCPGEPDKYTHDLTKKVEEWENLWHQLTDRTQIMTADEIHNMSIEIRKKEKEDDQT